jgi:hypothetical protein
VNVSLRNMERLGKYRKTQLDALNLFAVGMVDGVPFIHANVVVSAGMVLMDSTVGNTLRGSGD